MKQALKKFVQFVKEEKYWIIAAFGIIAVIELVRAIW